MAPEDVPYEYLTISTAVEATNWLEINIEKCWNVKPIHKYTALLNTNAVATWVQDACHNNSIYNRVPSATEERRLRLYSLYVRASARVLSVEIGPFPHSIPMETSETLRISGQQCSLKENRYEKWTSPLSLSRRAGVYPLSPTK